MVFVQEWVKRLVEGLSLSPEQHRVAVVVYSGKYKKRVAIHFDDYAATDFDAFMRTFDR